MEFQRKKSKSTFGISENSQTIISSQKIFTKKQEIDNILHQYSKCPDLTTSKLFYQKMKKQNLEEMVNIVLNNKNRNDEKTQKMIFNIIQMLKSGGGFAQFIADCSDFKKQLIFGFLLEQVICQNALSVFGEIFINLARSNPVKVLQIIKDVNVQEILIRNLKKQQIFNVIYTCIFCLNQKQSQQYNHFIHSVLKFLINQPFQDKEGQSIFSHCTCSQGESSTTNQQQLPSQIKKHVRKNSLEKYQRLYNSFYFCKKGCLNKMHNFFNNEDQKYFEQTTEVIGYLCDMLQQISTNMQFIYLGNVKMLIEVILQNHYIKQLFAFLLLNEKTTRPQKQQFSSEVLNLLYEIIKFFKRYVHCCLQKNIPKNSQKHEINIKGFKRERRKSIQIMLQSCQFQEQKKLVQPIKKGLYNQQNQSIKILQISKQISHYLRLFIEEYTQIRVSKRFSNYSSGNKVQQVGLSKFYILKIYYQLLFIIEGSNHQNRSKYSLKQCMPKLLTIIKQTLSINKWNNIIHKLVVRVIRQYVKICYSLFFHEAINIYKVSQGFLGFLIENFRNKFFVFLDTMRFTTQGDRQTIFVLSRQISAQLHSNRDLIWLFDKFPQWKQFMENDLQQYQHSTINLKYCDLELIPLDLIKAKSQMQTQRCTSDSSESVQEIVDFYKQNLLWQIINQKGRGLKTKNQISFQQQSSKQLVNHFKSACTININQHFQAT